MLHIITISLIFFLHEQAGLDDGRADGTKIAFVIFILPGAGDVILLANAGVRT